MDFAKKIKEFGKEALEKGKEIGSATIEKSKEIGANLKTTYDISSMNTQIESIETEIGKIVWTEKIDIDNIKIKECMQKIENLEKQIEEKKLQQSQNANM